MSNERWDLPDGAPQGHAVLAAGPDLGPAPRIARALAARGWAVLRVDGDVADLGPAIHRLTEVGRSPALLVGHGLGGAAVLDHVDLPGVMAVVTIGAPAAPVHAHRPTDRASHRAAVLVLHSPADEAVGIDNARIVFETVRHPKSFVCLDGADHLLTGPGDAEYAAAVITTWAARYTATAAASANQTPEGTVVVTSDGTPFGQVVRAGRHTWRADEPIGVGEDTGPSPYDLLLAALGTCTSMTIHMYARRKGWPVEQVSVALRQDHVHAEDCAGCKEGMDRITRTVTVSGDLDEKQRASILKIADRCPVHRTLTAGVVVETSLGLEG